MGRRSPKSRWRWRFIPADVRAKRRVFLGLAALTSGAAPLGYSARDLQLGNGGWRDGAFDALLFFFFLLPSCLNSVSLPEPSPITQGTKPRPVRFQACQVYDVPCAPSLSTRNQKGCIATLRMFCNMTLAGTNRVAHAHSLDQDAHGRTIKCRVSSLWGYQWHHIKRKSGKSITTRPKHGGVVWPFEAFRPCPATPHQRCRHSNGTP